MTILDTLAQCPVGEMHALAEHKYVLRVARRLPADVDLKIQQVQVVAVRQTTLTTIKTHQRILAYILQLNKPAKVLSNTNYVYAFTGGSVSSVKIVFQDSDVRLVMGGNGNMCGFFQKRTMPSSAEAP